MIDNEELELAHLSEARIKQAAEHLYSIVSNPMPGNEDLFAGFAEELEISLGVGHYE